MSKRRRWVIAASVVAVVTAGTAGILSVTNRTPLVNVDAQFNAAPLTSTPTTPAATSTPPATPAATTTAGAKPAAAKKTTPKKNGPKRISVKAGSSPGTGPIRLGTTYTGNGTFYAATGAGNCSFEASSNRMIGAMNHQDYANSKACGDFLAVTGPSGKTITIKVVDQCPECKPGDIDLSAEAFAKLAAPVTGRIRISWKLVSPALSGPVAYTYKTGSSRYWCGIQVRNHRNPVRSLEVKVNGSWKSLPRADYNYFLSTNGSGCGAAIRVTDIYGNRLIDSSIAIRPDAVQPGHAQFPSA